MTAQRALPLLCLLLAACGERAIVNETGQGSTTPPYVRPESNPSLLDNLVQPVRTGELGPSFAACNARGAFRERAGAGSVPVRAAPFAQAGEIDRLGPGADFFICSRTNDQRWFGIVYDAGGRAAERCGVTAPAPSRGNYEGPCVSGWVPSASVRLSSGAPDLVPASPSVEP